MSDRRGIGRYGVAISIFCISFHVSGQQQIRGHVRDSLNIPVSHVSVVLSGASDSLIIDYAYSGPSGGYRLECPGAGRYSVTFRSLGYRTRSVRLHCPGHPHQAPRILNTTLFPAPLELDTVYVAPPPAVHVHGDTVDISVRQFRRGNEPAVADLLKLLPGISVDAEGVVRVNGRPVEKVLIGGDDLFGNGYQLLTRNLDAEVIDRVQVIRNYDSNPLLAGLRQVQGVALNLELKDSVGASVFGRWVSLKGMPAGFGQMLHAAKIASRSKQFAIADLNNTGRDATGELYELLYPEQLTGETFVGDKASLRTRLGNPHPWGSLQEFRYEANEAETFAGSARFEAGAANKLHFLLVYSGDETRAGASTSEDYRAGGADFRNSETMAYRGFERAGMARVGLVRELAGMRLEWVNTLKYSVFGERQTGEFNGRAVGGSAREVRSGLDSRLTWTRRLDARSALQVTGRYVTDRMPFRQWIPDISGSGSSNLPGVDGFIEQKSRNHLGFLGVEATCFRKASSGMLQGTVGVTHRAENLVFPPYDWFHMGGFGNGLFTAYMRGEIEQSFGKQLQLLAGGALVFGRNRYSGEDAFYTSYLNLLPKIRLTWNPNDLNTLSFSYSLGAEPSGLQEHAGAYFLMGYRNIRRGVGEFFLGRSHRFLFNYQFGDWGNSTMLRASLAVNREDRYLGSFRVVWPQFTVDSQQRFDRATSVSLGASGNWFVPGLESNLKAEYHLSRRIYQDRINFALRSLEGLSTRWGAAWRTAWDRGFNLHAGSRWNWSATRGDWRNTAQSSEYFLDLEFRPRPDWFLTLKSRREAFRGSGKPAIAWFSDLDVRYRPRAGQSAYRLGVRNLFNTRSYRTVFPTDTGEVTSTLNLLPRLIALEAEFRF